MDQTVGYGSKDKWDKVDKYKVVEHFNGEKGPWAEFEGKMKGIIKIAAPNF